MGRDGIDVECGEGGVWNGRGSSRGRFCAGRGRLRRVSVGGGRRLLRRQANRAGAVSRAGRGLSPGSLASRVTRLRGSGIPWGRGSLGRLGAPICKAFTAPRHRQSRGSSTSNVRKGGSGRACPPRALGSKTRQSQGGRAIRSRRGGSGGARLQRRLRSKTGALPLNRGEVASQFRQRRGSGASRGRRGGSGGPWPRVTPQAVTGRDSAAPTQRWVVAARFRNGGGAKGSSALHRLHSVQGWER